MFRAYLFWLAADFVVAVVSADGEIQSVPPFSPATISLALIVRPYPFCEFDFARPLQIVIFNSMSLVCSLSQCLIQTVVCALNASF